MQFNESSILKDVLAKTNVKAYSSESYYALIIDFAVLFIIWFCYIVFIYMQRIADIVPLLIVTAFYLLAIMVLEHGTTILLRIDIAKKQTVETDLVLREVKTEFVWSERLGHSRVKRYFDPSLNVERYIIKCVDSEGKVLRIKSAMSADKVSRIGKLISENMKVRIRYLKKSKVLLSFVNIYHDGRYDRKRETNLLFHMNHRI